jgi:hypothetical protein
LDRRHKLPDAATDFKPLINSEKPAEHGGRPEERHAERRRA